MLNGGAQFELVLGFEDPRRQVPRRCPVGCLAGSDDLGVPIHGHNGSVGILIGVDAAVAWHRLQRRLGRGS